MKRMAGFAIIAVAGVIFARLAMGLLGLVFSLLSTVFWIGLILAAIYLVLKVVSPETAERIRTVIHQETSKRETAPEPEVSEEI